jgi:hypothetical protein
MASKLVWGGMFLGSCLGGAIPLLWGGDMFSISGIVFSVLGGLAGIWAGFRLVVYAGG